MTSMSRWLDVEVGTDEIDLNTLPSNLALVDLHNDDEVKLVVGDLGRGGEEPKLKIFRGAMQISDLVLPNLPLAVVGLHSIDKSSMLVAVAFSSCVYFYKDMKMMYKYFLPDFEINNTEIEVWKLLSNPENHTTEALPPILESLKSYQMSNLSDQSRHILSLTLDQQLDYLETFRIEVPEKKAPEITCIAALKYNSVEEIATSCVVIGTEEGEVFIVDPNFLQVSRAKICAAKRTPHQMIATGLFTVDYRITIATREKCVCVLKRDWPEGRILFTTYDHIIAIEVMPTDNSVLAICADNTLVCFGKKGKKQWSLLLEHRPISLTLLRILHLGMTLTGVGLASGHVHLYDGKARRDTLFVRDVASIMKFGKLGQEEHVFIFVTGSGNLNLKILKRTADFNVHSAGIESAASSAISQKPWMIPKKSKLFLEQSVRERENAIGMHNAFQHELNKLRLLAAKTLLEAHVKSDNSVGVGAFEPVRLSAEVEGLGPIFRVTLIMENTSTDKAVIGLSILFHVQATDYRVSNPYIKVPLLSPGSKLKFPTKIEEIFTDNINPEVFFRSVSGQSGERALVKVLLLKAGQTRPILAATVQMPPTDPMMLPMDKIQATALAEDQWGLKA